MAIDDSDGDEDARAYFPCPFCYVDIEVHLLCSHLQDEHCFDLKNAVCAFLYLIICGVHACSFGLFICIYRYIGKLSLVTKLLIMNHQVALVLIPPLTVAAVVPFQNHGSHH